ncbi:MAG TPA: cation-translocating P-type ATPase [Ignavibacteriales bacterium]|nr:cation-translocating P-type ATPase [Ignavibacteriales bacterium]HPP32841.1 cation-translocating P-type ATPase [Ignavibacteriales bacterium]
MTSIENIKNKTVTMELMYFFSISISIIVSLIDTILGIGKFEYYDTAIMLASFLSLGKYIENNAKVKTNSLLNSLKKLFPDEILLKKEKEFVKTKINHIQIGDVIKVNPGDIIPVDGFVIDGISFVDEASINGEPIPIKKESNDLVFAGSHNTNGTLEIKVERISNQTILGKIIEILETSQIGKTKYHKIVDKISIYFFPAIILIGIMIFVLNLVLGNSFQYSIEKLITIYVIACPCALALATPTAVATGMGVAAKNGIVIKNIDVIEKYSNVDTLIFDKTGTLTLGKPTVKNLYVFENDHNTILNISYNIAIHSNHPLLDAIKKQAEKYSAIKSLDVTEFEEIKGKGIKAKINDKQYYLGSYNFANEKLNLEDNIIDLYLNITKEGSSPIILFDESKVLGIFDIRDEINLTAKDVIAFFKNSGIKIILLSGDNKYNVERVSNLLGIKDYFFEALPERKYEIIKSYNKNNNVAYVGDGINDALALTEAAVGIALGNGSDIAKNAGDIIILKSDLKSLIYLHNIIKRILKQIKINIYWAISYNLFFIPLAAGIIKTINITPLIGALLMIFSSLSVILLSLTIKNFKLRES